ncbi:MAG: hypothetical protein R3215_11020, partial [Halomonas sp.]|nr:hypothetical protein [Halomonas sp.]
WPEVRGGECVAIMRANRCAGAYEHGDNYRDDRSVYIFIHVDNCSLVGEKILKKTGFRAAVLM